MLLGHCTLPPPVLQSADPKAVESPEWGGGVGGQGIEPKSSPLPHYCKLNIVLYYVQNMAKTGRDNIFL
jgi:hypothetical protein